MQSQDNSSAQRLATAEERNFTLQDIGDAIDLVVNAEELLHALEMATYFHTIPADDGGAMQYVVSLAAERLAQAKEILSANRENVRHDA